MTDIATDPRADRMAAVRAARGKSKGEAAPALAADQAADAASAEIDMAARAMAARDRREADTAREARRQAVDAAMEEAKRLGVKAPRPEEMTAAARSALKAIENERTKVHAARSALEQRNDPLVKVRILKLGDGKISTGVHVAPYGDAYFFHKEETEMPQSIAVSYEDRGWLEIV